MGVDIHNNNNKECYFTWSGVCMCVGGAGGEVEEHTYFSMWVNVASW